MRASLGWIGFGRAVSPGWTACLAAATAVAAWVSGSDPAFAAPFDGPAHTESVLLESSEDGGAVVDVFAGGLAAGGCTSVGDQAAGAGQALSGAAVCGDCGKCGGHGCHGGHAADCDPLGLAQRLAARHDASGACWSLRTDALILWRNAPAARPLFTANPGPLTLLDASQLQSPAAGGGRAQLIREDSCGNGLEIGYLYGGQFFSSQSLPFNPGAYLTAPPGLDGIDPPPGLRALDEASAQLVGSIQSGEINRRVCLRPAVRFLYGFRWFQWYETSLISDTFTDPLTSETGADIYSTSTVNNLWGGQIGLDALLLRTRHDFRVEGLVKAGAYANNAGQSSRYEQLLGGLDPYVSQVTVNESPASCSFAGEVGLTGVLPLCHNWDFRFGYLGLWLTGLAQPTNQLSGQNLVQGVDPPTGTLNVAGTVIVQGVTLGLEGRW
jgi:hypothetical protein